MEIQRAVTQFELDRGASLHDALEMAKQEFSLEADDPNKVQRLLDLAQRRLGDGLEIRKAMERGTL